MAKETYTRMSQFGTKSFSEMKSVNAAVIVVVNGISNGKVLISDFASIANIDDLQTQIDLLAQREPSTKEVVTVATAADLGDIPDPSTQVIYKTLDDNKLYIYDGHVFVDVTGHAIDNTVYVADTSEILTLTLDEGVYSVLVVAGSTVTGTYSLSVSSTGRILSDKDGWADRVVVNSNYEWRWHSYSYEGHKHTMNDITNYAPPPVDASLSDSSTNAVQNKVVKAALDLKGNITTIADTIVLSINPDTYVMSATLKKGNTVIAESNTIDLPLETMVVGGSYDSSTKKVILTLKNGQTVEFSVADLVSGLAPENHTHTLSDVTDYTVDSALSSTSENPVQNKVIYAAIGSVKNGGALTDAASIDVPNNSVSTLSTTQSALALNVNVEAGEVPNFAVKITSTAQTDGTVNVYKKQNGLYTPLMPSIAGGTTVEAGKTYQLTCVGDCWTLAEFEEPVQGLSMAIGGKRYKVVRIGNLYWMAENLDYAWNGLNFPANSISTTEPDANYYNGALTGSYGLLYSGTARDYMISHASELGFGAWRIPSSNDFIDLMDAVGLETSGTKLRATSVWADGGGTDDYGFNAYPTGAMHGEGALMGQPAYTYDEETTRTGFWASDNSGDNYVRLGLQSGDTVAALGDQNKFSGHSVRLCMDA